MADDFFGSANRLLEDSQKLLENDTVSSSSPLFKPEDLPSFPRPPPPAALTAGSSSSSSRISSDRKPKKQKMRVVKKKKMSLSTSSSPAFLHLYFLLSRDFAKAEIPVLTRVLKSSARAGGAPDLPITSTRNPRDPRITHIVTKLRSFPEVIAQLEFVPNPKRVTIVLASWVTESRKAGRILTKDSIPPPFWLLRPCQVDVGRVVGARREEKDRRRRAVKQRRAESQRSERRRTESDRGPARKRRRVGWAMPKTQSEPRTLQGRRLIDRTQAQFFACQRDASQPSANDHLAEKLSELQKIYEATGDTWRAFSYRKAINAICNYPKRIETEEDALNIRGVGASIAKKIAEVIQTGQISKVCAFHKDDRFLFLMAVQKIHGVGLKTAEEWWAQGIRSMDDVRRQKDRLFNAKQMIGLKYYDDFQVKIPRDEVERIFQFVRDSCVEIEPNALVECCGSYRRGRPESGDVDILITDRRFGVRPTGLLRRVVQELQRKEFIVDILGMSETSHMEEEDDDHHDSFTGVCLIDEIPRRLDLKVWKRECWAFAILYFTGDGHFNRSMRLWARQRGFSLSDHGIVECIRDASHQKIQEGRSIQCATEEEIFQVLDLVYREPTQRNTTK